MKLSEHWLEFYTSYSQFYIVDKESSLKTDSAKFWTQEAFESRLAVEDAVIGVRIECYGPVKAMLVLQTTQNNAFDHKNFDHIVEGSIRIDSGILQILDCPNSAIELSIEVEPTTYRVRVYSSNLNSVKGDEGNDFYRLEVWPSAYQEPKIIVKYLY